MYSVLVPRYFRCVFFAKSEAAALQWKMCIRDREKTAWYLKGTLELEKGDLEAAKADFDNAVKADEEDYDLRIDIFCSAGKYGADELGASYLQAVLDDESKKLSDFDRGRISFYLGDYEQARASLEKAQEAGGAEAASLLGQTYEALGDYNYAASVYSTYLETKEPDASIYNQLGLCKLKGGDYEAALAAFQAGMNVEGNTVTPVSYTHLWMFIPGPSRVSIRFLRSSMPSISYSSSASAVLKVQASSVPFGKEYAIVPQSIRMPEGPSEQHAIGIP